jgi:hypothetical protein
MRVFQYFKKTITAIIGSIGISILIIPNALALTPEEVNTIAKKTTVLIAPSLTPNLIRELEENRKNPLANLESNPDGVWNPGSGVIIAKKDNTYIVLTVTHNFRQRHLDSNLSYGIRTSDGLVHEVTQVNDGRGCPLKGTINPEQNLMRLGCYSINIPNQVAGFDLALVGFKSNNNYPVASLGNPDHVNIGDTVYVSGWPDPEKEQDPITKECRGRVARRTRRFAWGPVTGKLNPTQGQNGYGIFYLDQTRPGMSGGPVFDRNGFVVGIHGRGSADKGQLLRQYCTIPEVSRNFESEDIANLLTQAKGSDPVGLHSLFSSAQNLSMLESLLQPTQVNRFWKKEVLPSDLLGGGVSSLPINNSVNGIVDFDVRADLVDPSDVVTDIYEGFQLKNLLRDEPSSGCRFLLLGDPCD